MKALASLAYSPTHSRRGFGAATPNDLNSNNNSNNNSPAAAGGGGDNKNNNNSTSSSSEEQRKRSVTFNVFKVDWHKDVTYAAKAGRWETVRGHLSLQSSITNNNKDKDSNNNNQCSGLPEAPLTASTSGNNNNSSGTSGEERKTTFWQRLSSRNLTGASREKTGLLATDSDGRTPLHVALASRKTPTDILLSMIRLEPRAAAVANGRGRYPLHFAVVHRHPMEVIAELVDAYPAALSAADTKGLSPLAYALDGARRETNLPLAPRTFWMPVPDGTAEAAWQEEQGEKWGIVHWLLLSSATHPQTSLSVGGKKPMLVDALIHAAPPAVISLLIGASVMLLSHENRATAFAGSTLYSCIARHYPASILMSLVLQCPKDVHQVRDETGMGLVASEFISGCFQQVSGTLEWTVVEDFYATVLEAIEDEQINDEDRAFVDWWQKVEFLVAFCSGIKDPYNIPKTQLLHAALKNTDVPPMVIRMLLALYPQSIQLPDSETKAFPLFLIASRQEYVPRNYEASTCGRESILEIVVSHDKRAVGRRHELRLPIHAAIDAGRLYSELKCLVASHLEFLLQRDPRSGLYPFLQAAASYAQYKNTFRSTCIARNQFSYAVWKEMPDLEKASQVRQVTEREESQQFDSVYLLLRLYPAVIERMTQPKKKPMNLTRDSRGVGMIAAHYISWCFSEKERDKWVINEENVTLLAEALRVAAEQREYFSELPSSFEMWWSKMKFWIRYCNPLKSADGRKPTIPPDDEKYILHAALFNSDTPPQVVGLLLAVYPESVSLPLPDSSLLPLHIAAKTHAYTPRIFEPEDKGTLQLVFDAYPEACQIRSDGALPLHLAIRGGKTWNAIEPLVEKDPSSLLERDPVYGLYPFQLMAMKRKLSSTERVRFQHIARNRFDDRTWSHFSPRQRVKEIRRVQKEYRLEILACIFELLKRSASLLSDDLELLEQPSISQEYSESLSAWMDSERGARSVGVRSVGARSAGGGDGTSVAKSKEESDDDSSSCTTLSQDNFLRKNAYSGDSSSLLSKHLSSSTPKQKPGDVFECDTSVLSNVDVMSTMSSSFHANITRKASKHGYVEHEATDGDESSDTEFENQMTDEDQTKEDTSSSIEPSSTAEFAEDSISDLSLYAKIASSMAVPAAPEKVPIPAESDHDDTESIHLLADADDDEDPVVFFMIRRHPRFRTKSDRDAFTTVTLSKRPKNSLDRFSIHGKPTVGVEAHKQLQSSSHTRSNSVHSNAKSKASSHSAVSAGSYQTLNTEEKKKLKSKKDMHWVGNQVYDKNLLGNLDDSTSDENTMAASFREDSDVIPFSDSNVSNDGSAASGGKSSISSFPIEKEKPQYMSITSKQMVAPEDVPNRKMVPGIAAYLKRTPSIRAEKEETSVISNTPSTLSYLNDSKNSQDFTSGSPSERDCSSFSNLSDGVDASTTASPGESANFHRSQCLPIPFENEEAEQSEQPVDTEAQENIFESEGVNQLETIEQSNTGMVEVGSKFGVIAETWCNGTSDNRMKAGEREEGETGYVSEMGVETRVELNTNVATASVEEKFKLLPVKEDSIKELQSQQQLTDDVHGGSNIHEKRENQQADSSFSMERNNGFVPTMVFSSSSHNMSITFSETLEIKDETMSLHHDSLSRKVSINRSLEQSGTHQILASTSVSQQVLLPKDTEKSTTKQAVEARDDDQRSKPVETRVFFDKATMRWKKVEVNETRVPEKNPVVSVPKAANKSASEQESGMYFDKKTMRWRLRTVIEESNASTGNKIKQESAVNTTKINTQENARTRVGMPFVDIISRDSIRRRNLACAGMKHEGPTTRTPSDREFRGVWKHMFDVSEKRLCCLVCKKNGREVLMIPCRHLAICRKCAAREENVKVCPLCSKSSSDKILLF